MFFARLRARRQRKPIPRLSGPGKVKVGFPAGDAGSDVINIAIWNHYGTTTIPERPFLDNAMRDNRTKYRAAMATSARRILCNETSIGAVLSKLGILAQGHIQGEITALREPPNAPSTVRQKGSSNPLIDSGRMRNSVTYRVDQ